jgi:hypothetical protein
VARPAGGWKDYIKPGCPAAPMENCQVDLLKEIKPVQLQVLELQASLEKSGNAPRL